MSHFAGKVVIVTGGGSGIGQATAKELGEHGASVVVADYNLEGAAQTVEAIEGASGRALAVQCDVSSEDSVKAMVAAGVAEFGRVDGLVNCAGISAAGMPAPLHDVSLDAFNKVMAVNVNGTFLTMKYAIPEMLKAGGGSVVNLSSTMGERGAAGDPSYATSKHAVRGLTKSAALTYAEQGVRVNCIGPGVIKTAMTAPIFDDEQTTGWLMSVTPMRRFGESAEVAKLIVFLLSEDASYMTGAYYPIDGGWLAG